MGYGLKEISHYHRMWITYKMINELCICMKIFCSYYPKVLCFYSDLCIDYFASDPPPVSIGHLLVRFTVIIWWNVK